MRYQHQRYLAYAVAILLAGIAVVQAADPADFGLTPVMVRWLGVITAMLGVAAGFLPSVRGMSKDPEFLANRVWELPPQERHLVASDLADRADLEQRIAGRVSDDDLKRERISKVRTAGKASRPPARPLPPTPRYPSPPPAPPADSNFYTDRGRS
jgi:hypothetical protein